ncbi:hypothetical protein ACXYMT_14890 [Salinimicrobium sp. CAU 1759]
MTLLLLHYSCVKDVDLDQYEEIVLTPEAALDLIFFTITNNDFSSTPGGEVSASDETRLDFLDDDYIQNNLVRADFNFRFTNTFQKPLKATIRLLSPSNSVQHTVIIPIPAGTTSTPARVDYTETINEGQIARVRRSIKLSVEISSPDPIFNEGTLQLESKGFYYFEFE